jgi:hypothetical protein
MILQSTPALRAVLVMVSLMSSSMAWADIAVRVDLAR